MHTTLVSTALCRSQDSSPGQTDVSTPLSSHVHRSMEWARASQTLRGCSDRCGVSHLLNPLQPTSGGWLTPLSYQAPHRVCLTPLSADTGASLLLQERPAALPDKPGVVVPHQPPVKSLWLLRPISDPSAFSWIDFVL